MAAVLGAGTVWAESAQWTVAEAARAVSAGEMVLIDVRTPAEWKATGVAEGGWPVSLKDAQFGAALSQIVSRNRGKQIGFICATGARSAFVVRHLRAQGLSNVVDVNEGMMGNRGGKGWLKAALPLVSDQQALAAMPGDFTAR
jgi:rhodanese-related sulfurtransferase